jgi:hypothetical protein
MWTYASTRTQPEGSHVQSRTTVYELHLRLRRMGRCVTLNDVVALAGIANALAVVITLIVLIVSVRQNTKSQRSVAVDSLAAAIAAINIPAIESPAVGTAVSTALADWSSATREQRVIAHFFLFSLFKLSENAWYQRRQGILDAGPWRGWERLLRKYYHSRGVREVWWPHRRGGYSEEFQQYLATTSAPQDVGDLAAIFDDPEPRSVGRAQAVEG